MLSLIPLVLGSTALLVPILMSSNSDLDVNKRKCSLVLYQRARGIGKCSLQSQFNSKSRIVLP